MRENNMTALLEYLYDQMDMLSTVDVTDADKVDGACKLNRAVNDTAKSILGIADLSLRAYNGNPGTVSGHVFRGLFEEAS